MQPRTRAIVTGVCPQTAGPTQPRARRPGPDDAVRVARELLDRGERVDMQAVARELGVSRATVHRWFGLRDDLVRAVFERLAEEFTAQARAQATGAGDQRLFDVLRRLAGISAAYEPMRVAAAREPGLTLQLIIDPEGPVYGHVLDALTELAAATRTPDELARLAPTLDTFLSASVALHWATIAGGREPDPQRYEDIGRALLAWTEQRA